MSDPRVPERLDRVWRQLRSEASDERFADLERMAIQRGIRGTPQLGWFAELEDLAAEIESLRPSLGDEDTQALAALSGEIEALQEELAAADLEDPARRLAVLRARAVALAEKKSRPEDAHLTAAERARAAAVHAAAEREFLQTVANLSEEQWSFRPGPNRWSIREITEHVIIVEEFVHNLIEGALAAQPDPSWHQYDLPEAAVTRVLDRAIRGTAPPPMVPRGEWSTEKTMKRYRAARSRTRSYLERGDLPLRAHVASGPPGTFNTYHWLILVSLHHQRHNQQVAEVMAHPDFPRNPA